MLPTGGGAKPPGPVGGGAIPPAVPNGVDGGAAPVVPPGAPKGLWRTGAPAPALIPKGLSWLQVLVVPSQRPHHTEAVEVAGNLYHTKSLQALNEKRAQSATRLPWAGTPLGPLCPQLGGELEPTLEP